METELDEDRGQKVGSCIRLTGRIFGVEFLVEEIVTERNPLHRKVWETTGAPKLLVIGHYRMSFELSPQGNGSGEWFNAACLYRVRAAGKSALPLVGTSV